MTTAPRGMGSLTPETTLAEIRRILGIPDAELHEVIGVVEALHRHLAPWQALVTDLRLPRAPQQATDYLRILAKEYGELVTVLRAPTLSHAERVHLLRRLLGADAPLAGQVQQLVDLRHWGASLRASLARAGMPSTVTDPLLLAVLMLDRIEPDRVSTDSNSSHADRVFDAGVRYSLLRLAGPLGLQVPPDITDLHLHDMVLAAALAASGGAP